MAFILAEQIVPRLCSPLFPAPVSYAAQLPQPPAFPSRLLAEGASTSDLPWDTSQLRAERRMALPKPTMKRSGTNKINPCHALSLSLFLYVPGRSGFTGRGKLLGNICQVRTKRYLDTHPGCTQEEGRSTCGYSVPFKNTRGNKHKVPLYREAGNTELRQFPPLLSVSLVYYI